MLTQIWSATDIMFCHFRPFFDLLTHYWPSKKNIWNIWRYYPFTYHIWFLKYKVQGTEFFVIFSHFCPLTLLTTQKNQNFEKQKKNAWRYHFTLPYDKWWSLMYDSWHIKHNRQIFLSFQAISCPFNP